MNDLVSMITYYRKEGYNEAFAEARVCQDIVLKAINESHFDEHITIKGGVVMRSITHDIRRATRDLDMDFLRYPLEENAIRLFIEKLNCMEGITIEISQPIVELSQQEYRGKRIFISIRDTNGYTLHSKIDLGVHKQMQIAQDELCFDVCMDDEGASLLANSKEQIFAEKLRSLLRFGAGSTRFKDVFDMCYLSSDLDHTRLLECIQTYIFNDAQIHQTSISEIVKSINRTFHNKTYMQRLSSSNSANWLGIPPENACQQVQDFIAKLA